MKIKLPKIRFNLVAILLTIFVVCIVLEIWTLYQGLYLSYRSSSAVPTVTAATSSVDFDLASFNKIYNWLQTSAAYEIQDYSLQGVKVGRENPFADYK